MAKRLLGAGELRNRIEFFENITPVSDSGTVKRSALQSLGKYWANRTDASPSVDDDDRLLDISVTVYQMRFVSSLFDKGGKLIVRDFDGDWEVSGPLQVTDGRKRYMQFKCVKRG